LPGHRTRAEAFDDHVRAAIARLSRSWERQLRHIEVAVEQVPPSDGAPWETGVPLGRAFPAAEGLGARVVLYRGPIEKRADGDLGLLVLDVLVEELAHLLDRAPEDIDPGYGR
jgi:predicted Zn-dependent protease with MMP-like domain